MNINLNNNRRGISTIEMMIAVAIGVIIMLGISGVLASNQRSWNTMYSRVYSDVITRAHIAKRAFDGITRKASNQGLLIDGAGKWVEVCYYQTDDSTELDRYARFIYEEEENELFVEYGQLNPRETISINTICDNVTNCIFKQSGNSVHMILTINNGSESQTIGTSAQLHN